MAFWRDVRKVEVTFYESLDELQRDLDEFLAFYNRERAHQGYRTQGRTPTRRFQKESNP